MRAYALYALKNYVLKRVLVLGSKRVIEIVRKIVNVVSAKAFEYYFCACESAYAAVVNSYKKKKKNICREGFIYERVCDLCNFFWIFRTVLKK